MQKRPILKDKGFYTKVGFQVVNGEQLILTVINNSIITEREKERISERISDAKNAEI